MKTLFNSSILLVLLISIASCEENKSGILPEKTKLTESVYSSANVEPNNFYKVYAATRGIVDEIFIDEGDLVKQGDLLLKIVNDNSKLQSNNALLELDLASENYTGKSNVIEELENQLELAILQLKNDSTNFDRQKRLWQQKIGSQNEFEKRKLTYESSQNKVVTLQNQLKRKEEELKVAVQKSRNNYTNQLNLQADFEVRSLIDGKVYELLKEKGESVSEQEPIAYIGSENEFTLKMQVDEVDIVKVKKEQLIYVTLDSYPSEVFEATVNQIIPKMNQETQTFWVEGVFKNAPKVLYAGLRGEANIVIAQKTNALTIPLEYLYNEHFVITEEDTVKVTVGLKSLERVEILDGIDSTTLIFKN